MLALRHAGHPDETRAISLAQSLIEVARHENVDAARQWLRRQVIDAIQHAQAR